MEFINIKNSKLKVILSKEDCERLGIDTSDTELSGAEMRKSIREILIMAKTECGFSADGERILAQFYQLPSGECELLVSLLGQIPRREREILASSRGASILDSRNSVYRFASFDDMRRAAQAIRERPKADLYLGSDGVYYISLEEQLADGISEVAILIEYGERLTELPLYVLSEYGKPLAQGNAFEYILGREREENNNID